MKFFKITLLSIFSIVALSLSAQDEVKTKEIKTAEFAVTGVCGMCKSRIENAALIKGVKLAQWDKQAQMLKVIYRTDKTSEETIKKAVADVGHDTGEMKAPDAAYKKLPDCCAYRDGVKVH